MRKGSKGLPNKNLKIINGKPLLSYTLNQALDSRIFNNIVISTDSEKIKRIIEKLGIKVFFMRPKRLSGDKVSKIDVIKHAVIKAEQEYKKRFEIIFDLDVTSPLRHISDIKKAYRLFMKNNSNNLFSVCEARRNPYFNQVIKLKNGVSLVNNSKRKIVRRQDSPEIYDMNASIYIWKREYLFRSKTLFGKKTSLYIMPFERSIDIDNYSDFRIVTLLLADKVK
tara:strand:+ start:3755 stop:4426 length:672 start_codon:yes stop_codon:yes gene_type:complete